MGRHLRAAFVLFHLLAITLVSLPSVGGGMRRSAWRTPTVQAEFDAWTARLQGLGLAVDREGLEDRLWAFASGYEDGRDKVLGVFEPYYRLGTWQSWRMFVAPHRFPARLEIEIGEGQGWTPVYVARSSTHDWLAGALDHDRFRAATFRYGWAHYRVARHKFVDWVALRAAEDFPEAQSVRVSFVRYRTGSPEDVRAGVVAKEKREFPLVRSLRSSP